MARDRAELAIFPPSLSQEHLSNPIITMSSYDLPAPRRITASNLPLPSKHANDENAEPGVEVKVDTLQVDPMLNGALMRAVVATSKQVPTSNDGQ